MNIKKETYFYFKYSLSLVVLALFGKFLGIIIDSAFFSLVSLEWILITSTSTMYLYLIVVSFLFLLKLRDIISFNAYLILKNNVPSQIYKKLVHTVFVVFIEVPITINRNKLCVIRC